MSNIFIHGENTLHGEIEVQGSKNAVLPILAATLLVRGVSCIRRCPQITDVKNMVTLLRHVGCMVVVHHRTIYVDATHVTETRLPADEVGRLRSSILFLGALIGRCKEATIGMPGGCSIGERPIDIHLFALRCLGVQFERRMGYLTGYTESLAGAEISLRFPSVGATENCILAAVLAQGKTRIENCATEPEIEALCLFLKGAGAKIEGIGTPCIEITGVKELHDTSYEMKADRIVAGTYLFSAIATKGEIEIVNAPVTEMCATIEVAKQMGAEVFVTECGSLRIRQGLRIRPISYIRTGVYPGFSTDLQSILLTTLTQAQGESVLEEKLFENRLQIKRELEQMGASILSEERIALISGRTQLYGCHVTAHDLRGGAALCLAGICAKGTTIVGNCHYIERGYEDICRDYEKLGADIHKIR